MPKTPLASRSENAGKRKASEALSQRPEPKSAPATPAAPAGGVSSAPSAAPSGAAGFDTFSAAALIVAFLVYITAKGELGSYLQLFLYTPVSTAIGTPSSASPLGAEPGNTYQGALTYYFGVLKEFGFQPPGASAK